MIVFKIDDKDRKILMILQRNARESLTCISREINLSVDAVHKRIRKLSKAGILETKVHLNLREYGYPLVVDVKIKLKDASNKDAEEIINYLKRHPRVIDLLQILGDWDLTCVVIAKDAQDLANVTNEIRYKFNRFIADWRAMMILNEYKFEKYDMMNL